MPGSGIREWWRAQLDAPRIMSSSSCPSICPCASCYNGTRRPSATERECPKERITTKKWQRFGSRESIASDMVPLCTPTTRTSRSSLENHP
ncbi:hypothetical protein F5Y09DRAFT_321655 [Xylaria sp. FL1042]|nr:hypothetical protein F5Y09DRAFT_321655 [Xylaria sp. FL1042]